MEDDLEQQVNLVKFKQKTTNPRNSRLQRSHELMNLKEDNSNEKMSKLIAE
jgi:hypothetical protein